MNGKFLLDTNIIIALFGKDANVLRELADASDIFVPAIVLGELFYGAAKSNQTESNNARIEEFAAAVAVVACDASIAREYGRIKNDLRAKGRPLPENDIWIAAIASRYGLTLVSRDRHFDEVNGLSVAMW